MYRLAKERGWHLHTMVCTRDASGGLVFVRAPESGSLPDIFSLLKPDGVLDTLQIILPDEIRAAAHAAGMRSDPLVVHIGSPASTNGAVYVHGDPESFAKLALRELLQSGFRDFAYVPYSPGESWSVERGEAFARFVTLSGRRFHPFPDAASAPGNVIDGNSRNALLHFLAALPKPCGVFAASDIVGEIVLNAARMLGFGVPGELAVVSLPATSTKPGAPVLAAGDVGRGRVAVMADPMAFQPFRVGEAGNARLLRNLFAWLLRAR